MIKRANDTTIDFTGAAPNYVATFTGPTWRINPQGHIWLGSDPSPLELPIKLLSKFKFSTKKPPIIISDSPQSRESFHTFNGVFSQPVLSNGNSVLTFTVLKADHKVYYYLLNLEDPKGKPFQLDPIIVNK